MHRQHDELEPSSDRRGRRRPVAAAILLLLAVALIFLGRPRWSFGVAVNQAPPSEQQQLDVEKLRQEILNLQRQRGFWGGVAPSLAPLATAVVAIAGLYFTVHKQNQDRLQQLAEEREAARRQQTEDLRQQEKDRLQRESESLRLFLDSGKTMGESLDAEVPAQRASAIASISTFLGQDYQAFHPAVFMLLVGNLRSEHSEETQRMLLHLFEKAIRLRLSALQEDDRAIALDLSRTHLDRVDLAGLPLQGADFAFAGLRRANLKGAGLRGLKGIEVQLEKARLSRADLEEARMQKAHCEAAQFHQTRLVSARFEDAVLTGAQFYQAQMQGIHLNRAHLEGAMFAQANVSDAIFTGAVFDDRALQSLAKAENWCNAQFDDGVIERLEAVAGRTCPPAKRRRAHSPA